MLKQVRYRLLDELLDQLDQLDDWFCKSDLAPLYLQSLSSQLWSGQLSYFRSWLSVPSALQLVDSISDWVISAYIESVDEEPLTRYQHGMVLFRDAL